MLALEAGEPVPPDRLIDVLWPEYDEGAPARLQVYVSQLRKAGAARLLGEALELWRGDLVPRLELHDRTVAAARELLGDEGYDAAFAARRTAAG